MTDCAHELRIVMDLGHPDPRLVVCRRCRARWRATRVRDA